MNETQFSGLSAWITEVGLAGRSETDMLAEFCDRVDDLLDEEIGAVLDVRLVREPAPEEVKRHDPPTRGRSGEASLPARAR